MHVYDILGGCYCEEESICDERPRGMMDVARPDMTDIRPQASTWECQLQVFTKQ